MSNQIKTNTDAPRCERCGREYIFVFAFGLFFWTHVGCTGDPPPVVGASHAVSEDFDWPTELDIVGLDVKNE